MENTKKYEIKECLLITYRVFSSIFFEFAAEYPKEIREEINSLLKAFHPYLEKYDGIPSDSVLESRLYREITFYPDE